MRSLSFFAVANSLLGAFREAMFHAQGTCSVLVVTCGEILEDKRGKDIPEDKMRYPFPELVSWGRLEVQTLTNPSKEEFCKLLESYKPNLVYLQGEQLENDEVGSLAWRDADLSTAESISDIFDATLPTTVYLEVPNGEELAVALQSKGIPYVVYWKVVQSSSTHTRDAFQLAHASFRLYCVQNNHAVRANYVRCIFKKSKDAYEDALAAIRGGRIPPPESMPSFEEGKEVLGFNSYYEVVYTVFKGQLKMQNQKNQSPQDPIVEVITSEVYNNYGADGFKDSFFGMQQNSRKRAKSS